MKSLRYELTGHLVVGADIFIRTVQKYLRCRDLVVVVVGGLFGKRETFFHVGWML